MVLLIHGASRYLGPHSSQQASQLETLGLGLRLRSIARNRLVSSLSLLNGPSKADSYRDIYLDYLWPFPYFDQARCIRGCRTRARSCTIKLQTGRDGLVFTSSEDSFVVRTRHFWVYRLHQVAT